MKYRFRALAKLREPDELDAPAVLTSARGWIALAALATVTAVAATWAVAGRLPLTVTAGGLIARPGAEVPVQSEYAGQVTAISSAPGGRVRPGQELAVVRDPAGASHPVRSLFAGRVTGFAVAAGQVVAAGSTVATIERTGRAAGPVVALLFLRPAMAAAVRPGQSVRLAVASAPAAAFGLLRGQVQAVGEFPLTAAEADVLAGGAVPARTLAADAGSLLVTVRLLTDRRTASGYSWTTAAGPPQALPAVVPVTGMITLGEQAPVTLLFGR